MTMSARDDAIKMVDSASKTALKVTIDATHSGVITNWRVYPGIKVMQGYKSFISKDKGGTSEYDKPVLKNHDIDSDPVGRVVGAKFTMYKSGLDFENDFLYPENYGSRGSGVVTVDAIITDPDTIKKIIDGRFISVSAGHRTDMALCSVCGDNVMVCPHIPSKRYDADGEVTTSEDGALCYVITNDMLYNEVSFVNLPAQPPAKLLNYNWMDCKSNTDSQLVIGSMVTGAKDLVRAFSLVDSDDELNLLTGRKKSESKKTTVAVKPAAADKLKAALSTSTVTADDDKTVHQKTEDDTVEPTESDQKANNPKTQEGNEMDAAKLQELKDSLEKELSVAKAKITELETSIAAKDAEVKKLSDESKTLDSKMRKTLATSLVGLKMRLKKPDVQSLDTAEKRTQFVDKLAIRSVDSLEDAVADLMYELDNLKEETKQDKQTTTVADIVGDKDKVEDPSLKKGTSPEKSKDKAKTSSVDLIDRELGL